MIFGDPCRFAIWVEVVPEWSDEFKNGLFYFIINGNMYPGDIRVATLSADLCEVVDDGCALVSQPRNESIFSLPVKDAFESLYKLAYPEPSEGNEYPDQVFDYCITPANVSGFGGCFFAVADQDFLRIVGGEVERLVKSASEDVMCWENVDSPKLEDVILSREEINKIIFDVKEYACSVLEQ